MSPQAAKLAKTTDNIISWVSILTIFLLPIFFNPLTANVFDLNKRVLLVVVTSILLILWMAKNIITRTVRITLSPFTLPLVLFTLAILVASYRSSQQFIESLSGTTILPLALTFFFITTTTNNRASRQINKFIYSTTASSVALSIMTILESIQLGPTLWVQQINPLLINPNNQVFLTPAGSPTVLIAFLIPTLILTLGIAFQRQNPLQKGALLISSAIITAALVISIFNVLPGKPNSPVFLPLSTSWQIAVSNMQSPRNFLLGSGPSDYVSAFSANKPASFNLSNNWNIRFATASNLPLHLFTTIGIIGLSAWFFILFRLYRLSRHFNGLSPAAKVLTAATISIVIINFLIPTNTLLTSLFFFFLLILSLELKSKDSNLSSELILKLFAAKRVASGSKEAQSQNTQSQRSLKAELLPLILGLPFSLFALTALFGSYRVYAADLALNASLVAARDNRGTDTYRLQGKAVTLNPYNSSYRRSYAATNLAVANAIAQGGASLSDQDRTNVTTLIQQAIREAKAAVLINPNNPANWESLAVTYRNLINIANNAQNWAVSSYSEAITRDPNNPRLRLELGGIYYQLEQYDQAIQFFTQATQLKPNWANAHYNLAVALRDSGDTQRAIISYENAISLLDPSTADYNTALSQLNELKSQVGQDSQEAEVAETELNPPQPLPAPLPNEEEIILDEKEAAPPEIPGPQAPQEETPQPTPSPETSPEPTPTQ